jgi:RNA-binding protein 5/10
MPALFAHSDPKKVKIDFSTPLGAPADPSNSHGGQWSGGHHAGRPPSDAMRDIGSPGGGKRVLLLRGMNYHTTGEEVMRRISHEIARLVGKVGRERDAETAIVRVVRIVDREARNIWGFGFVELATPEVSTA